MILSCAEASYSQVLWICLEILKQFHLTLKFKKDFVVSSKEP